MHANGKTLFVSGGSYKWSDGLGFRMITDIDVVEGSSGGAIVDPKTGKLVGIAILASDEAKDYNDYPAASSAQILWDDALSRLRAADISSPPR